MPEFVHLIDEERRVTVAPFVLDYKRQIDVRVTFSIKGWGDRADVWINVHDAGVCGVYYPDLLKAGFWFPAIVPDREFPEALRGSALVAVQKAWAAATGTKNGEGALGDPV